MFITTCKATRIPVTEPIPARQEFVTALWRAMPIGDVVHLIWICERVGAPETGREREIHIRTRLVVPVAEIPNIVALLSAVAEIS